MAKVWAPGHYLNCTDGGDRAGGMQEHLRQLVRTNQYFAGYMASYWWRYLEPSKGVYDASTIIRDLNRAQADGKKLWVRLMERSFHGWSRGNPVPDYIQTEYNGLYDIVYGGQNILSPKFWEPAVGNRWLACIQGILPQISGHPAFQGILTEEVSLAGAHTVPGWTWTALNNFWLQCCAIGSSLVGDGIWHQNAGWSNEDENDIAGHYAFTDPIVRTYRCGISPTDLSLSNFNRTLGTTYGKYIYSRYRGEAVFVLGVEYDTYGWPESATQLINHAYDLGVQFVYWEYRSGGGLTFTTEQAIQTVTSLQGRIVSTKPSNVLFYETGGGSDPEEPPAPPPSTGELILGMSARPRLVTKHGTGGTNQTIGTLAGVTDVPRLLLKEDVAASGGVAPTWSTSLLDTAVVGETYSEQLVATGDATMSYSIVNSVVSDGQTLTSAFPSWASLYPSGTISGLPDSASAWVFAARADNGVSPTATRVFTLRSVVRPDVTTTSLPEVQAGASVNLQLEATGTEPLTWTKVSGSLPSGVALNATTGAVRGRVSTDAQGDYTFVVKATSADIDSSDQTLVLTVLPDTGTWTKLPRDTEVWIRVPRSDA